MIHFRRFAFAALLPFVFASCNAELPHLQVLQGNYNVSRGDYQRAIVDYLRARQNEEFEPWIAYNLGNVYHFLGESIAAVEQWERVLLSDVPDLQYGAAFNHGVYLFEQGRHREALNRFRFALTVNPSSIPAKRNYEIALDRLESGSGLNQQAETANAGTEESRTAAAAEPQDGGESTATRMLDYVRRKEEQRWRANAEQSASAEVRDW